jgi:cytochrome P450
VRHSGLNLHGRTAVSAALGGGWGESRYRFGVFDPADPRFLADPYPAFAAARVAGEVQWHAGLGMHVALSHRACNQVLRDRGLGRIWRDREPAEAFPAFNLLHRTSLLESQPPSHTRLRSLVAGAFSRGHVERMRPWVHHLAGTMVSQFAHEVRAGLEPDLIAAVAEPLPVEVIAQLLGVPPEDRPLLRPWSNAIVKMYEPGLDPARQAQAEHASARFVAYLRDLITDRRAEPLDDDLITDLIAASAGEDRLSTDEIVGTCVLLLMAGHEASVNVAGNGVLALLRAPGQWRRLVAEPLLAPSCVEEMIRIDPPLQLFERTAVRDTEICGVTVPAGHKVAALLGAACHDPAQFSDPGEFRIDRAPNGHLGFGAGIHFCLGAPLARIELHALLAALVRDLPDLALAHDPPRRPEFVIRGLSALHLTTAGR